MLKKKIKILKENYFLTIYYKIYSSKNLMK
jgi:hypothetical protein